MNVAGPRMPSVILPDRREDTALVKDRPHARGLSVLRQRYSIHTLLIVVDAAQPPSPRDFVSS